MPDGEYMLQPWTSTAHPNCYSLMNVDLDVFVHEPDNSLGRWAILIHVGNYIEDIVGCIAIGLTGDRDNVYHSKPAMDRLRQALKSDTHRLIIEPKGAVN